MLDRAKLLRTMQQLSDTLFVSYASEYTIAHQVWQLIAHDITFIHRIAGAQVPWPLPTWSGRLDSAIPVVQGIIPYCGLSVDGSQSLS